MTHSYPFFMLEQKNGTCQRWPMINANAMPMTIQYDDEQIPPEAVHDDMNAICYLCCSVVVLLEEAEL